MKIFRFYKNQSGQMTIGEVQVVPGNRRISCANQLSEARKTNQEHVVKVNQYLAYVVAESTYAAVHLFDQSGHEA
ncbi:hypothetical protein [Persicobacter sp. CCB-QB2]|uniref:hypothetical protein n=1 Tax=Persicobacter sp. CCB-QB2 TaxID=1561025 RepID=UPI0006A9A5D8|nr:hypothetical protein [Persicobacter sp. CCB-QB2]